MTPTPVSMIPDARFAAYCEAQRAKVGGNRRVLLVQVPQIMLESFNYDIARSRGYYIFPPTGLMYLHDAIKHRDLEVRILDLNFELLKRIHEDSAFRHDDWPTILQEAVAEFDPAIVGVSCLFDVGLGPMKRILDLLNVEGGPVVVCGGVIATYEWERLLSAGLCHFVVRGEGENKLNYLLDHITPENLGTAACDGIYYRDDACRQTEGPPDVVKMESDLIDSYDLVPIAEYYRYGSLNPFSRRDGPGRVPFAAVQFARGCRAACSFCAVRDFMGRGVRHRPVEAVLREIEFLVTQHGVGHFEWLDDDPTFYRDGFKEILRGIIARGLKLKWSSNNGIIAASVDDELLELMRDSGCIGFKVGIETGNPDMLRKVKKPATHDKFRALSAKLRNFPQIFVGGNFIIGLPGEQVFQMMDSFRFALEVRYDWAAMTVCQIIRGASAFSDSGEYFESQIKAEGKGVGNFIPTRASSQGQLSTSSAVRRGLEVFNLEPGVEPDADQVKEIWFAFNLLSNYVFNKNLSPGGNPEKFIAWVENARKAYPGNPYMALFLSLAYILAGDRAKGAELAELARRLVADDSYWGERVEQFHLAPLLAADPCDPDDVHAVLGAVRARLREAFAHWLDVPYGSWPGAAVAAVGGGAS